MHDIRRPGTNHPVFHSEPFTPAALGGLDLGVQGPLQRTQERYGLQRGDVVVLFHGGPAAALGCEEVVAALLLVHGSHAAAPVVAEEAVQHAGEVHAGCD